MQMAEIPYDLPDARGHFGPYGGTFVAETLTRALDELREATGILCAGKDHDSCGLAPAAPSGREEQVHCRCAPCRVPTM